MVVAVLLIGTALVPGVHAQDGETWYFAYQEDFGAIVAFTPDGSMNGLALGIDDAEIPAGWRLGPDRALVLIEEAGAASLYSLMSDSAQVLASDSDWAGLGSGMLVAAAGDYAVVALGHVPGSTVNLLIDVAAGTVEPLPGDVYFMPGSPRVGFSADGARLRYWSRESAEAEDWALIERTLADGSERVIHTLTGKFLNVLPDATGDHWLMAGRVPDEDLWRITLLNIDGTQEIISEVNTADDLEAVQQPVMFGDMLGLYPVQCETDCPLTFTSLSGGDALAYTVPVLDGAYINPLQLLDDGTLIANVSGAVWALLPDGAGDPLLLGYLSPRFLFASGPLPINDHMVLALDDPDAPTRFHLWDTVALELVKVLPVETLQFTTASTSDDRMVITVYDDGMASYAAGADGAFVELPTERYLNYMVPVGDDSVLATSFGDDGNLASGIYRYDITAGEFTMLVPDALWINVWTP